MRQRLLEMCGVAAMMLFVSVSPARGQTTAVGPYYATPSWDQTIACTTLANCPRFVVLSNMNNEAVLDRETGLVWQRSPRTGFVVYEAAAQICPQEQTGGRFAWRLPSPHELESLLVPKLIPAGTSGLFLPDGHPFVGVGIGLYWTSTFREGSDGTEIWTIGLGADGTFSQSGPFIGPGSPRNAPFVSMWCVRGGGPIPLN